MTQQGSVGTAHSQPEVISSAPKGGAAAPLRPPVPPLDKTKMTDAISSLNAALWAFCLRSEGRRIFMEAPVGSVEKGLVRGVALMIQLVGGGVLMKQHSFWRVCLSGPL